jgi:hypothetical protein
MRLLLARLMILLRPTSASLACVYPADDDSLKAVVIEMVVTVLRRLSDDGSVIKSGKTQDAQWTLAPSLLGSYAFGGFSK